MHTPVSTRSAGASHDAGSTASSSALNSAPAAALIAKMRRGSARSARPSNALAMQPTTKPACTPLVSAACWNADSPYSATSAGTAADAENHSAIAATWHSAMIATEAVLAGGCMACAASRLSRLHLRQRHALLALVLSTAVLVRRLA